MALRPAALLILSLALAAAPAPLRAQEEPEAPAKPKAPLTADELEKKLDKTMLTVDWKDSGALDALNEVRSKTGIKLVYDQDLAEFAETRKVTYDGYQVTARDALRVLQRAIGFAIEPDTAEGGFKLTMDAAAPTGVALKEKRLDVAWNEVSVSKAISDIERKTGIKIELHATMKPRLEKRKITWEAERVTAKEAIETLYVYPPPAIAARIDTKKGMKVLIVYTGMAETRADCDLALEDRKVTLDLKDAGIDAVMKAIGDQARIKVDLDVTTLKEAKKVTVAVKDQTLRAALDALAKAGGLTWKIDRAKIMFRAAPAGK